MQQLQASNFDIQSLLSSSTEITKHPGDARVVPSVQAASQAVGFSVKSPSALPPGVSLNEIRVQGEGTVRFTADTERLKALLDAAGVTDVKLPTALNGKTVTVNKPALVIMSYGNSRDNIMFLQSHNPQVQLPDGVDMAQLGEIALRFAGMKADEARNFARTIDWTSTLLVPVPATATSFSKVMVGNSEGLLITTGGAMAAAFDTKGTRVPSQGSTLVWVDGDMVYAITGAGSTSLIDIATSLR
jgi:hypothetical protein